MGLPPVPHTLDVDRATEVVRVLAVGQPAGLAGGLAGLAAISLGAVLLVVAAPRVRLIQPPTMTTLTRSGCGHWVLPNRAPIVRRHRPVVAKKIQDEEDEQQQKKTIYLEGGRRPSRRRPHFQTGGFRYYQNGGDNSRS